MKFTSAIFAFTASLVLVSAQNLGDIPTCAIPCFVAALPASGCSTTDTTCQCTTGRQAIMDSIATCLPSKCNQEDQAKTLTAGNALCEKAGISQSSGSPTSTPTGSAASSGSPSATSSAANAAQTSGAAVANKAGMGIAALGFIAALGL